MTKDLKPEAMDIIKVIATSPSRLTPQTLAKILSERTHLKKKEIKALIKNLVAQGELTYT